VQAFRSTLNKPDWSGALGRWMIFISGAALLVATMILPAQADLRQTRIQRDLALHTERAQLQRIERFERFLIELEHPDAQTIDLLANAQLGLIPDDRDALIATDRPSDPQLFEHLEPIQKPFVPTVEPVSRLEGLTTGSRSRLWVTLVGAVAVLYGLLPGTKG